jgi:large subunit ribosomal protein L23
MSKFTALKPRISEKAYKMSQEDKVYVFEVPGNVNKLQVAAAVTSQFEVDVVSVNILNVKGKVKQQSRKRGKRNSGARPDIKKAYVTLKEGQEIAIFPKEEDDKAKDAPPDAKSKKAARSTK